MLLYDKKYFLVGWALLLASGVSAHKPERSRGHEQVSGWSTNTFQSLEFGVLLEVEGYASKIGGESQSDILLATAAFDLESSLNEWLLGHVGLLWEQYSREDDNIDEAYIALGGSSSTPFDFVAGRFYQPFGNFETAFISDPMTLELAEMNKTSAMVGYADAWFDLNVGVFNGDVKFDVPVDEGRDTTLDDFYAAATVIPMEQVTVGVYWLSDLMETDGLVPVGEEIANLPDYEKDGGAGAFANFHLGWITVNAEYVSALNGYDLVGGCYVPAAFNIEVSAQIHEQVVVGLKYEASDDLYASASVDNVGALQFGDKLPGQSFGAVVTYAFHENATVAAEYMRLEELDDHAAGDLVTVRLGLAF